MANDNREKLDPMSRPCMFLGYGYDEFGYRLWDLVDKKFFWSGDIIFIDDKAISDWELEKKIMNSGSTGKDQLKELRTRPTGS